MESESKQTCNSVQTVLYRSFIGHEKRKSALSMQIYCSYTPFLQSACSHHYLVSSELKTSGRIFSCLTDEAFLQSALFP